MKFHAKIKAILVLVALLPIASAHAASVFLSESLNDSPLGAPVNVELGDGTVALDLWFDFSGVDEANTGGGVGIELLGGIAIASFTASPYYQGLLTDSLSAFSSGHGDSGPVIGNFEYEVHAGKLIGDITGKQLMGTLLLNLISEGPASLALSLSDAGSFGRLPVEYSGADLVVGLGSPAPVPVPAAIWLMLSAFGILGISRRRT